MMRLPDVNRVRCLVQDMLVPNDSNDPLTLWDLVAAMLMQLGDDYDYNHLQTDTVMVVDPQTSAVKWSASEPFLKQHDPDWLGGGWISVYDNNDDGTRDGKQLGGSRVWLLKPGTQERRVLYPTAEPASQHERGFYSQHGGKAQRLADGRWMIVEPQPGRVFEIDASGRTVWEWGHQRRADGVSISEVLEGTSYTCLLYTSDAADE